MHWLTNLFQAIWNGGTIPEDWKKGIINLHFYNGKGNGRDCKNYRRITLLSCPVKLFAQSCLTIARVKTIIADCHA